MHVTSTRQTRHLVGEAYITRWRVNQTDVPPGGGSLHHQAASQLDRHATGWWRLTPPGGKSSIPLSRYTGTLLSHYPATLTSHYPTTPAPHYPATLVRH